MAGQATSLAALLGRIFWMAAGPLFLAAIAIHIALEGPGWASAATIAYFSVLGGMMLGRWLEFRSGQARTAMDEPATAEHLRRYLIAAASMGLGLWVVLNLISSF